MIRKAFLYVALVLVSIVMLTPLIWLVSKSFTAHDDFFKYQILTPPGEMPTSNFNTLFPQIPYLRFMLNSFFVAGLTVMVQLVFSAAGGFALAKYDFRGKRLIMLVMLMTLMLPGEVLLAPLYGLIYNFGLMDSYAMPGCRPMIGAFCLIAFMGSWNSYIWPQLNLHSDSLYTLPIGVSQMVGTYKEDYGALMAGTLLSVIPVVILFFALQREFIAGLTAGAVKG